MNAGSAAFIHAVRGPILLITLGVLLAIDHTGNYSFWRTWPILIILFGCFMLLERALSRTAGSQQGGRS